MKETTEPTVLARRAYRHGVAERITTYILILLAVIVLLPLFLPWMFVFKTQLEYNYSPWAIPKQLYWKNFSDAWKAIQIGQGMKNTFLVCLGAICCSIPCAALAGYVFARYRNKVTEVLFYAILIGYFVPAQMVLIPLYKMSIKVGLVGHLYGLFLPMTAFNIPFWTMIYRSFFKELPGDLAESATIDGAGHAIIFLKIMLPLAAPATVLAALLIFIGAWSDYLLSLIMINDQKLYTIQLRVSQFLSAYGVDRMPRYAAAAVISAAPTLILYLFGHRWIIRGTLAGALKG
jgi:ABC-type glycerol-3-phosphate transport system permease component